MATRATYQFKTHNGTYTFYIHHDGYPEGAWEYFVDVKTPEDFIRENEDARLTKSHDVHGDTEYRYTVQNGCVQVERREFDEFSNPSWETIYIATLEAFIEDYKEEQQRLLAEYEDTINSKV